MITLIGDSIGIGLSNSVEGAITVVEVLKDYDKYIPYAQCQFTDSLETNKVKFGLHSFSLSEQKDRIYFNPVGRDRKFLITYYTKITLTDEQFGEQK